MKAVGDWLSGQVFRLVHGRNLVYNTCWEDPRLDRVALRLGPDDTVLVITSAGCNALDYALCGVRQVHAVDMNRRQNALLELKQAAIRALDFDDFFQMFGRGWLPDFAGVYAAKLRPQLSEPARRYWDRKGRYFRGGGWRGSFYFHGTSGVFARLAKLYIDRRPGVRRGLEEIFAARDVAEQRRIYERLRPKIWNRAVRWVVRRDSTLSLLGVPRAQREQVERRYPGGIARFIEDSVEAVFAKLPLADNYFWRLYVFGAYTPECCPEYLKPAGFAALKAGLVDRVATHTASVEGFLRGHDGAISRFVLLDHMDWLSTPARLPLLRGEWEAIAARAAPRTRMIWRGGGLDTDFIDNLDINLGGRPRRLGDLLRFDHDLAAELHERDRVHTYGCFRIADWLGA
jgi:S-adenosylmethionine-diacylglycerol 3-amino-3-carboxypropyl transferase